MALEMTLSVEIRMTSSQDLVRLIPPDLYQDVDLRAASWEVGIGQTGTCNHRMILATAMGTNGGAMEAAVGMAAALEGGTNAEATIMAVAEVEAMVAAGMVAAVAPEVEEDMEAVEVEAGVGVGEDSVDLGNKTALARLFDSVCCNSSICL